MNEDYAIKIEHLSKIYKIFDRPFDRVKEALHPFHKRYSKDFYALNDVSFTVKKGETLGIIGKNGAGKSTLLKIITGVLTPTSGSVEVNGRVASLLELGAGFNPEMTGIENIYMNGMFMGRTREEMNARLEDIVAFADIGDFIHQPVKVYSSGMFARLAFAVNVAIEPDVLIVDEALAVGDFMFQFKCMQRFQELRTKGITILFVSHSSAQIAETCNRAIYMKNGGIARDSVDVQGVIADYESATRNTEKQKRLLQKDEIQFGDDTEDIELFTVDVNEKVKEYRFGTHDAVIHHVVINQEGGGVTDAILRAGKETYITYYINAKRDISSIVLGMSLKNAEAKVVWGTNTLKIKEGVSLHKGRNKLVVQMLLNIVSGQYLLYCGLADLSDGKRIELDQRWPVERITVIADEENYEGVVYSPIEFLINR